MELIPCSMIIEFIVFFILLVFNCTPTISAHVRLIDYECIAGKSYKPNSTYQLNLNKTLNSLLIDTQTSYGFYKHYTGDEPNRVEATALCRGDISVAMCRDIVPQAVTQITTACPNQKSAFGYTDTCVIYYGSNPLFSSFQMVRVKKGSGVINMLDSLGVPGVNRTVYSFMENLKTKAASGDSKLKFASDMVNVPRNGTVYGVVQCTPDLSQSNCAECVQHIIDVSSAVFFTHNLTAGGRWTSPSCNLRLESYPFVSNQYIAPASASASPPASAPSSSTHIIPATSQVENTKKSPKITGFIIIPIAGLLLLIAIAIAIAVARLSGKKKPRMHGRNFDEEETEILDALQFSLATIKAATDDFCRHNKLGEGGFGIVYKGKLPDGKEVAVKRLSTNSGQGDVQFKNEILILAKLLHTNLVRLLGFCLEGKEMILVYELVANKSLDTFLIDPVKRASLLWETRYKLIKGIAKGLQYLHEDFTLRIIHRDLKAGNVLLDAEFNPKIADFGMARLFNIDQTRLVTNQVVGTYGYMPPEYIHHGQVSIKLDVFSFGVLVLEMISGSTIRTFGTEVKPENLLFFAWKNWQQGTVWNMVDPVLSTASKDEIIRCVHISLLCVQHNQLHRPTMSSVALMLDSSSVSLQTPSQPAFFTRSEMTSISPNLQVSEKCSINEVSLTMPWPR